MGANQTSRYLKGHTISEIKNAILTDYMHWYNTGHQNGVLNLIGPAGIGKCLGKNTPVLKFDGSIVMSQDINPGDLLMGPDSKPRLVKSISSGTGELFQIQPKKGNSWVCNDVHVLTLVDTVTDKVVDISLDKFLSLPSSRRNDMKLFTPGSISFTNNETLKVDPYFLGVWLGDGRHTLDQSITITTKDEAIRDACLAEANKWDLNFRTDEYPGKCTSYRLSKKSDSGSRTNPLITALKDLGLETPNIPAIYLTASLRDRLELLAGLVDSDGNLASGCFEITQKSEILSENIAFLARSVGLRVTSRVKGVPGYGNYFRLVISGHINIIPTRLERKRAPVRSQKKDALRTGFKVMPLGEGEYFGFTLDGDGRYLLGDFTVTHNTEAIYQIADTIKKDHKIDNCQVVELYLSSLMDPESAAGTPVPVDFEFRGESVKALALASRSELLAAMEKGRGPILFIDEMGREADQLRPLIMKLLHEHKLGGLDVSSFYIIVAGNPCDEEHNAVAIQEDAAISSRLVDIPVKPDVKELGKYLYNFTPSHRAIADFLLDNPQYMHGRDTDGDQGSKFHSPRSWFNAACKLQLHGGGTDEDSGNIKGPIVSMILTGIIGPQAFSHLRNFLSMDKPLSVKDVLTGRFKSTIRSVPPSTQQALKTWLAEQDISAKEADNIRDFLKAIPADTARGILREAGAGNVKVSNNRLLVARGVYKEFLEKVTRIKKTSSTVATTETNEDESE